MAYLTYGEYQEMGGTLESTAFSLHEFRARKLIDHLTFGRLVSEIPVRESVKYTMMLLIEHQVAQAAAGISGGREMTSVSIDGMSVSYSQGKQESDLLRRVRIVQEMLSGEVTDSGTSLLYVGVSVCQ